MVRLDHSSFDLYDRLSSIRYEAELAFELANTVYPSIPWVANERAGSWYLCAKKMKTADPSFVYFKSTDGHSGKWDVNPRRLNLHLIDIAVKNSGVIVIDVTKQGKIFPDSLSKTIPLWCCVINRLKAKHSTSRKQLLSSQDWDCDLHVPINVAVSELEANQMSNLVPQIMERLEICLSNFDWNQRLQGLEKPLRPIWIHPNTKIFAEEPIEFSSSNFIPVILYCASDPEHGDLNCLRRGFRYVQGGGDDHESWLIDHSFDRNVFWDNVDEILKSRESHLEVIKSILKSSQQNTNPKTFLPNYDFINERLAIGSRPSGRAPQCWNNFDIVVNLTLFEYDENKEDSSCIRITNLSDLSCLKGSDDQKRVYIHIPIEEGKKGRKPMYNALKQLPGLLDALNFSQNNKKMLIHCQQGKDRSVCMAIFISLFLSYGSIKAIARPDKNAIKGELVRIQQLRVQANPSRFHMQTLNSIFCELNF